MGRDVAGAAGYRGEPHAVCSRPADRCCRCSRSDSIGPAAEEQETPPIVGENRDPRAGPPGKTEPKKPGATVPIITDVESGHNELEEPKESEEKKSPPGQPSLRLPTTDIVGGGPKQESEEEPSPAQEKVEEAVEVQEDLYCVELVECQIKWNECCVESVECQIKRNECCVGLVECQISGMNAVLD